MFCKNCGTELNESAEYCSQCGLKVEEECTDKKIITPKRNILVAIVVALVAVVIAIMSINSNGVNSSPEKVAIATVKSEYEIDIKTMMKCFPDFTIREIAVEEGLSENASRSQVVKEVEENYRYETPQRVEIINTELVDEFDTSEYTIFRELHDYMTDSDYNAITKIATVNVEFTVDGEKECVHIVCIKMKNKWYFLRT